MVTARAPSAKTPSRPHPKSELDGPLRGVVYIFEDEGDQGGGYWRLVLECGHAATRKRYVPRKDTVLVHALLRPLSEKLAPKKVKCCYCGMGSAPCDPWILIEAFGGPKRP